MTLDERRAESRWQDRARLVVTAILAAVVVVGVVTAPEPASDRALTIGRQIRCPVCSGESIADSTAGLAADMMELVEVKIDEGLDDEQVIDAVLAGYGSDAQRLDPPFTLRTAALWLVPLAAAGVGVGMVLGRRRPEGPS